MATFTRVMIAVLIGVGGIVALYLGLFALIHRFLPSSTARRAQPWVFIGPLLTIMVLVVLLPTVRTIILAVRAADGSTFVGLENLTWALTSREGLVALRNNALWVVSVTVLTMGIGMMVAIFAEKTRTPRLVRAIVFMPMAISAVGASVIWRLVYAFKPAGVDQIGILNQLIVWFGGEPRAFLVNSPWNNLFLIWIMVWIWTGFATVVFAAALRTVPDDLIEAARIDGASEVQTYRSVIFPYIRSTIVLVLVATVVTVLKVFDIIRVSTNGQFETNVIANEMIQQAFRLQHSGRGSVLAVLLFILVIPFMWLNHRELRRAAA